MKMPWFIYALFTLVLFTALYLLYKYVGQLGVGSGTLLFYYYLFALPLILIIQYSTTKTLSLKISDLAFFLLLIAAIVGVLGNFFIVQSLNMAPNPGYSIAVSSANVLLVTIFSVFL